jgi:hypothetical protein
VLAVLLPRLVVRWLRRLYEDPAGRTGRARGPCRAVTEGVRDQVPHARLAGSALRVARREWLGEGQGNPTSNVRYVLDSSYGYRLNFVEAGCDAIPPPCFVSGCRKSLMTQHSPR